MTVGRIAVAALVSLVAAFLVVYLFRFSGVDGPGGQSLVYRCGEGEPFEAVIRLDDDAATVTLDGERYTLPHVPSGSGARYSNGTVTFWTKGAEAMVEIDGEIVRRDCVARVK